MPLCLVAAHDPHTRDLTARALEVEFERTSRAAFDELLLTVARQQPDVVVMIADPEPPDGAPPGWIAALGELRAAVPDLAVLVAGPPQIDHAAERRLAAAALTMGARGYLRPGRHTAVLLPGSDEPPPTTWLSQRELQVLQGMTDGLSNSEIAAALGLADDTVKTHARRLFRKLGAHDRAHAVARGFRRGLLR